LHQNRALLFCFDAFSSREPVSTSLENAPDLIHILDFARRCAEGPLRKRCRHEFIEIAVEHA
jgi:hypothetical protein